MAEIERELVFESKEKDFSEQEDWKTIDEAKNKL